MLEDIYTPLEKCTSVFLGPVSGERLGVLQKKEFDQAPVLKDGGPAIGVVMTAHLTALRDKNLELLESDEGIIRCTVDGEVSLDELLRDLSEARAVLVREEGKGRVLGLLTISDLNRHEFRAVLYQIFAELEAGLARLLTWRFNEPWDWIAKLAEHHQAEILGHWELAKKKGINIGPEAAATLTHLIKAVGSFEDLRGQVELASTTQFGKATGSLPDIRNRIMHPVRPMILGLDDVADLRSRLNRVFRILDALAVWKQSARSN